MSIQEEKLKAIADAIRSKEGTTGLIHANDFAGRILELETDTLPDGLRTIEVKSNASARGTVSGGGMATDGVKMTASAAAKSGYKFSNWREGSSSVSTDAEYTFDVSKDRTLTAVFDVKTSRLPSGYKEVEYVQSDRACGIDTGIKIDVRYHQIIMDIEPTDIARMGEEDICGMLAYKPSSTYFYCAMWRNQYNQIYGRFLISSATNSNVANGVNRMNININLRAKQVYVDDTSFTAYTSTTTAAFTNNFFLFFAGTPSTTVGSIPAKLYSAQIYYTGSLQRDFVPCVNSSGTAGLYDLVGGTFYQNSKSGVLTAGPEI